MSLIRRLGLLSGLAASLVAASCSSGGGGEGTSASSGSTATGASSGAQLAATRPKPATTYVIDREGEAFLERNEGKLLCHVKGTPREMGEQYGALLGDRIETLLRNMPAFIASQNFPAWLLPSITTTTVTTFDQLGRYPADLKEYADGVVAGNRKRRPSSFMSRDDILFLTSLVDLGGITNGIVTCSTVAVWGPIAKDGKMFQTRNVDLFTGSGIEDNAVVVIEKRDGKIPWANAGWAGMLGSASGMNAHGVATGQVWAFSDDKWFGEPWVITTRRIMENAWSSEEAVAAFRAVSWRTYGANFVFGDRGDLRGGQPKAYAIESSAQYMAVFEDNDPKEDLALVQTPNGPECYAIKIPFAVFRGDVCLDPGMRSRSTGGNGPTGDPRGANSYRARYKGQADRVLAYVNAGTPIGAPELISLTQGVATAGGSLQCVVYANTDLELWVADARRDLANRRNIDALQEPYVRYDFDYYLPTIDVALDRPSYRAGETQLVTIVMSSLGSDRDLELACAIEAPAGTSLVHADARRIPLSFRRGTAGAQSVTFELPLGMGAGSYKLVASLYERGTSDLVDVAIAPFDVQ